MGKKRKYQKNLFMKMILAFIFCMVMLFGAVQALADDAAPAANTATVECYALVSGEWKLVTVEETAQQMTFGSRTRYYITADELEQIYGEFGFSAASYAGGAHLPPYGHERCQPDLGGRGAGHRGRPVAHSAELPQSHSAVLSAWKRARKHLVLHHIGQIG